MKINKVKSSSTLDLNLFNLILISNLAKIESNQLEWDYIKSNLKGLYNIEVTPNKLVATPEELAKGAEGRIGLSFTVSNGEHKLSLGFGEVCKLSIMLGIDPNDTKEQPEEPMEKVA